MPFSNPEYDILTFGDLCVDLIVSGEDVTPRFGQVEKLVGDYTLELGGSCSIFACQAAKLGLRTAIIGKVGADSFGNLVLQRLRDSGVDTRYVVVDANLKTGIGIALCTLGGDRAILTYTGSINAVTPGDVTDELLSRTRHLHHGSYFLHTRLRPHIPHIFKRARAMGSTISIDTNWDPEEKWGAELNAILPQVDVFLPNEQEALCISGVDTNIEEAASCLLAQSASQVKGARLAVIKQGEKGAFAFDGQNFYHQAVEPVSGGDSIGAGDSFDAGFLAGWLRGLPVHHCLQIACACGRSVASQTGGLAGQLTWLQATSP